ELPGSRSFPVIGQGCDGPPAAKAAIERLQALHRAVVSPPGPPRHAHMCCGGLSLDRAGTPRVNPVMAAPVLVIDFGSQVTQLIARRVREAGVYCEIVPFNKAAEELARGKPQAV